MRVKQTPIALKNTQPSINQNAKHRQDRTTIKNNNIGLPKFGNSEALTALAGPLDNKILNKILVRISCSELKTSLRMLLQ